MSKQKQKEVVAAALAPRIPNEEIVAELLAARIPDAFYERLKEALEVFGKDLTRAALEYLFECEGIDIFNTGDQARFFVSGSQ